MLSQNAMVLDYMRKRKAISPLDALRDLGVHRLGARIYELRNRGNEISMQLIEVRNRFGVVCRIAEYRLIREARQ